MYGDEKVRNGFRSNEVPDSGYKSGPNVGRTVENQADLQNAINGLVGAGVSGITNRVAGPLTIEEAKRRQLEEEFNEAVDYGHTDYNDLAKTVTNKFSNNTEYFNTEGMKISYEGLTEQVELFCQLNREVKELFKEKIDYSTDSALIGAPALFALVQ